MARHIDAWMDGIELASVGPVLIKEVHEDAPSLNVQYDDRAGRSGQMVSIRKRTSVRVAIEMQIRELFDLARRSHVCEDIARWAEGSVLELSNHPGRQLHVVCTAEPALGEVRDYTSSIRVEFEASVIPYWEDKSPNTITVPATGSSGLLNAGSVEAPVILEVTPSGTLTAFSVTAAGQTISFTGLNVTAQQKLIIGRDALDNLTAMVGTASQLSKRTAISADDLLIAPGVSQISYTANVACTVTARVRGRYA